MLLQASKLVSILLYKGSKTCSKYEGNSLKNPPNFSDDAKWHAKPPKSSVVKNV